MKVIIYTHRAPSKNGYDQIKKLDSFIKKKEECKPPNEFHERI